MGFFWPNLNLQFTAAAFDEFYYECVSCLLTTVWYEEWGVGVGVGSEGVASEARGEPPGSKV